MDALRFLSGREAAARRTSGTAFSLIELLITLALMLVMFVMLYSFGSRSHQQRQKRACERNLRTIYLVAGKFRLPALYPTENSEEA